MAKTTNIRNKFTSGCQTLINKTTKVANGTQSFYPSSKPVVMGLGLGISPLIFLKLSSDMLT